MIRDTNYKDGYNKPKPVKVKKKKKGKKKSAKR